MPGRELKTSHVSLLNIFGYIFKRYFLNFPNIEEPVLKTTHLTMKSEKLKWGGGEVHIDFM